MGLALTDKMHDDEIETNAALVRRLLVEQHPQWAGLPITRVESAGTDNAIYRLGSEMSVRLPRVAWAVAQVEREQRWLRLLAPRLPLAIPIPLAVGKPGAGYPWPWSVYRWLEGETPAARLADTGQAAMDLAQFIYALQRIETIGAPTAGKDNSQRGVPLAQRAAATRRAIASLGDRVDGKSVTAVWESALHAPVWSRPPVWLHGDLQPGNLLAVNGRLTAVIDFGCLGVGDPACDMQVAWNFLGSEARTVFRQVLGVDDATWVRGRGWALSIALIQLPYYWETNPTLAAQAQHTIAQVLADC